MTKILLVKDHPDYKNINEEFLQALIDDRFTGRKSRMFFKKSLKFYIDVKNKDVLSLSDKQRNWLWEISCILNDRLSNISEIQTVSPETVKTDIVQLPENPIKRNLIQKVIFAIKNILK